MNKKEFKKELESLINRYSLENGSNTPDYVLSNFVMDCILAFDKSVSRRERYYKSDKRKVVVNVV